VGRAGVKDRREVQRKAPRPMNRDSPPLSSALRLSLQPLIGGVIEALQARSSTLQDAQTTIMDDNGAWAGHIPPLAFARSRQSINPNTPPRSSPDRRHHVLLSVRSDSSRANPSPQHVHPSRILAPRTPRPRCGQPRIQEAAHGPWHVVTGWLAAPKIIAISINRPTTRHAVYRLSIKEIAR
jgi:hypothetical protein